VQNWDDIRSEFETSNITLAALAEKYGIKVGTLKSRKSREGWTRGSPKNAIKKDATKAEKVATTKRDATIEPVIESDDLTEKQKLFCLYYIKYYNATKAYQKAYGCSYETANAEGYKHLVKPRIKKEIERLKAERDKGLILDARAVIQKYIDIALADITDYVSFGQREEQVMGMYGPVFSGKGEDKKPVMQTVNYVDLKESSAVDGTIITEVKQGKDGVSIKLADKMKALEMLTKYTDLLSENDKKRLQQEKLKMDIEKTKAEVERLAGKGDDKPIEIVIKRKGERS